MAAPLQGAPAPAKPTPAIPPELAYERVTLPPDQNAMVEWQQAVALYVRPEGAAKDATRFAWTMNAKPLTGEERAALEQWLMSNQRSLELMEKSLGKSRLQWPQRRPEESEPTLTPLRILLQARLVQAAWQIERNADAAAAEHLQGTLRLAELAADGEGAVIHYLVGIALESLTYQAIQKFALESSAPAETIGRLLGALAKSDGEVEVYARALRVEFHDYVLVKTSAATMAEQWQEMAVKSPESWEFMVPEELQRAFHVFLSPALVAQHPRPLDHPQQVAAAIPNFQRHLANARGPWKDCQPDPDPSEIVKRFLKDSARILAKVKKEKLPLSKVATERIRPAYNRFSNPVGRLFDALSSPLGPSYVRVFRGRTEREATRLILALRLFFLHEKRWPESLSEVVDRGFLDAVPADPYGTGKFHYSRARGVIWSIGEDGRDDDGKSAPGSRWNAPDAVWSFSAAPK